MDIDIVQWLKDWAMALSADITLLLAIAAFCTIWQNYLTHKKELKIKQLDKIVEWITDIEKTCLEVNWPISNGSLTKEQKTMIEADILLRYGIPFIRNDYIKAIVTKLFKKDLQQDTENLRIAFAAFLFCKGKSFGIENIKSSFRGTLIKIIEDVEKRLKEESLDKLLEEYSVSKSKYANILLIKIGNIVSKL